MGVGDEQDGHTLCPRFPYTEISEHAMKYNTLMRLLVTTIVISAAVVALGADSLSPLNSAPQSVEQLWAGYDPRAEPLEVNVVREWQEDGLTLRYITYSIGTFKGSPATMAAFYGFPTGGKNLPAVMHMHGGGQRLNLARAN